MIFVDGNANGNLTKDANTVCKLLAIQPDDIVHKERADFEKPGMSQ